ncbi:MAG: hypothetical protein FWC95_05785 [Defluviitaleaceae bacterium]|nr:hypothetical protein [Defluviitaleaceae bacterium]
MKEYTEIMELSQKLSDPDQTRQDMQEAVAGMIRNKYLSRMNETFTKIQETSRKDPPKEATLLQSLKPFIHDDNHSNIDRMIDLLILAETLGRVKTAADSYTRIAGSDGVYEVDMDCMKGK